MAWLQNYTNSPSEHHHDQRERFAGTSCSICTVLCTWRPSNAVAGIFDDRSGSTVARGPMLNDVFGDDPSSDLEGCSVQHEVLCV